MLNRSRGAGGARTLGRPPVTISFGAAILVITLGIASPLRAVDRLVPSVYATIQLAINAAVSGDRVLVDPGTYPEKINLLGKNLEVIGVSGASLTLLNAGLTGSAITIAGGQGASTRIEGFTITGGLGQLVGVPLTLSGGGIYISQAHPTIIGCDIVFNQASNGAGVYLNLSAAQIIDCTFSENSAAEGGGIVAVDSAPLIQNCSFTLNFVYARGGALHYLRSLGDIIGCTFTGNTAARGGAISLVDSDPELIDCVVSGNTAIDEGGGISLDDFADPEMTQVLVTDNTAALGGGIDFSHFCQAILVDVEVVGNTASEGGGIRMFESCPLLERCRIIGNDATGLGPGSGEGGGLYLQLRADPLIRNSIIAENNALYGGGLFGRWESEPRLIHATVAANTAVIQAGGIYADHYSIPLIWNSIVYGNIAPADPTLFADPESSFVVRFSDIEGGFPGPGNLGIAPLLTPAYTLGVCSPVIDRASAAAPDFPPFDIDGHPRIQGLGPDMGSWESPPGTGHCFSRGDVNADEAIDLGDVLTSLSWLFGGTSVISCEDAADVNDSGTLDISDPIQILGYLFMGAGPPPPPEISRPGPDPTPDALPCN